MSSSPRDWTLTVDAEAEFSSATAAQEELLRGGSPAIYVAAAASPGLSYGVGVSEEAPYVRRGRGEGLAVSRRTSGGSGIIHLRGDLIWAVVLPRHDSRVRHGFVREYPRLGRGLSTLMQEGGVRAEWTPAPGLNEAYCPLSSRGSVLSAQGRIVGAAAQHATPTALLHQGLLSARIDRALITRVFQLDRPEWAERLTSLEELGVATTPRAVAQSIRAAMESPD
jgi:lipoate-protein ligase A